MAEFDVLKEYARMVQADKNGACKIGCINCPISVANNGENKDCVNFMRMYPEKATEIIHKWSQDHPKKTRGDLVLEHFPNANLDLCPGHFMGKEWQNARCDKYVDCDKCCEAFWNEVVE